jgi:hypothetical protein
VIQPVDGLPTEAELLPFAKMSRAGNKRWLSWVRIESRSAGIDPAPVDRNAEHVANLLHFDIHNAEGRNLEGQDLLHSGTIDPCVHRSA